MTASPTTTEGPSSCDGDCTASWNGAGWDIIDDGCVDNGCSCAISGEGTFIGEVFSFPCTFAGTTPAPTTTPEATTTPAPTTTPEATTTESPTTTPEATTTPAPTTTPEATTTESPTTTPEATTTPAPTTTPEATTTPAPTTTEEPWTTTSTTTTTKPPTTPEATTPSPTTTPEPTTQPPTTQPPTTQPPTTQPPTTQPPTTPPGGTTTCEPGSQACIAEPPEPAWIDLSGDFIPPEPFLWWPVLSGPAGCTTRPAFSPTFAPACIGDCPEIELVPGCLDPGTYQVVNYCDVEQTNTCFGLGDFFRGHRWTINGFSGRGSAAIGGEGGVWESGVQELTPNCNEDTGQNPMIIEVSRPAQEIILSSGENCRDAYGNTIPPVKLVLPTIIPVCVVRDGTTSGPCPV